jgi:hypothetical protein
MRGTGVRSQEPESKIPVVAVWVYCPKSKVQSWDGRPHPHAHGYTHITTKNNSWKNEVSSRGKALGKTAIRAGTVRQQAVLKVETVPRLGNLSGYIRVNPGKKNYL